MSHAVNANVATSPHDRRYGTQMLHQNRLLGLLTAPVRDLFANKLELVELQFREVLNLPNEQLKYAYFPTSAIVSLQYTCNSGATTEVAGVGHEGVVGLSLFLGSSSTTTSAIVQSKGHAFRLQGKHVRAEMERGEELRAVMLQYAPQLLAQVAQTSVCNRYHTVAQQVCRWLLSMLDRAPSSTLQITHDAIATALGVRREGVTEAAGNLQRSGVIRCQRGQMEVLNRDALEARACECYAVVKQTLLSRGTDRESWRADASHAQHG